MLDNLNRLDLTANDIELIESALHTQKKILSVQSQAGATGAGQKLNELTQLTKRIGRSRTTAISPTGLSWTQMVRGFFCTSPQCRQ